MSYHCECMKVVFRTINGLACICISHTNMRWVQEDVEVLIEEHRTSHPLPCKGSVVPQSYKIKIAWQQIKELMQKSTVDQLMSKMNGLRSHFSNELSKLNRNPCKSEGFTKEWIVFFYVVYIGNFIFFGHRFLSTKIYW